MVASLTSVLDLDLVCVFHFQRIEVYTSFTMFLILLFLALCFQEHLLTYIVFFQGCCCVDAEICLSHWRACRLGVSALK
jgi:hypothetical protein